MTKTTDIAQRTLNNALIDLSILAGEIVGPSDASWQDVAGTAAVNLRVLAQIIEERRVSNIAEPFFSFPSVEEAVEQIK